MSEATGSIGSVVAALYRRYRPEAFAEMIGQSQVTEPLMTALRTGRIGHAYLFSGPRGCGKTTSARILARCLNCAEGPTDTPCGTCPSCVELSRDGGGSLDVVEIDAASHGGVDDARDLRERAVFAPARDRFKIFIIDEAHMVTPGGFNALLKIVEEPPPHVKFIFATTEPDKVIGTIRSRTHHYPFRLIAPGTLIDYVQSLCDSEGVQVEPGVLPLVVRAGGGSVRDTLSILDQLIAGSETSTVSAERAAGLLGFTHSELLDDVVVAFGDHDAAAAFRATDRVVQTGQDPRRFVEDLLERLRDLIVVSATTVDGAAAVFRGVPQDQLTRMFSQSQAFARGELSRIADTVSSGLDKMAGATAPRLQLELMIARALVVQEQNASRSATTSAGAPAPAAPPATAARPSAQPAQAQPAAAQPVAPEPAQPVAPQESATAPNAAQTAASIREFLREGAGQGESGAQSEQAQPVQPQAAPSATAQPTQPTQPAERPQPARPASPAQQTPPAQGSSSAPHPNEGAASFGRPISDILSTSQIASIGSDTPPPAKKPAADATPAPTGAPSPEATPSQGLSPSGSGAGDNTTATPDAAANESAATEALDEQVGLEDLLELWPDLLEEILERDRDAWNAVRVVTPMGLDGDVLTVGLASQSDLAAFKTSGAGPLRETILSAVGISVKYVPKRLPEGGSDTQPQGGGREPQAGSSSDAEEPHPAGVAPQDDLVQRAAARLSALGPALAAPAWADPPPAMPASDSTPVSEPATATESETPTESGTVSHGSPESQASPEPSPAASENVSSTENVASTETDASAEIAVSAEADGATESAASAAVTEADARVDTPADFDPSVGEYVEPANDPYDEGDPFAGADSFSPPTPVATPPSVVTAPPIARPAPAETPATVATPSPASSSTDSAPEAEPQRVAPAFTRYGEAVVREVLGARFIEERPLPPRLEA